jgi:hypothetical protein
MNVPGLGELEQDDQFDDWWISEPAAVPCLEGQRVDFTLEAPLVDGRVDPEFVDAVDAFLRLTRADLLAAGPRVFRNYQQMFGCCVDPADEIHIATADDVWSHVSFHSVHVLRDDRDGRAVYVRLGAECDWEIEHGLQLVFRRGRELTRVSGIDGHVLGADD